MPAAREDARRVERAIRYLERHYRRQPPLADLARAAGLSPHHFQRLFKRWAGVTPKRFLQFLTVEHAKRALREGQTVLAAAYEAGLSGPGRLHDLFVTAEAVTPGEYRSAGHGVTLTWGVHPSPFGPCLIAVTERGIARLAFVEPPAPGAVLEQIVREWPDAALAHDPQATAATAARIFDPAAGDGRPITLALRGTNFQLQVWQALLRIPAGRLASYGDVARAIGRASATRAVASAVARNPVAFIIPCHRVIRSSGVRGGYRWGAERKKLLIGWEAAQRAAPAAATRG